MCSYVSRNHASLFYVGPNSPEQNLNSRSQSIAKKVEGDSARRSDYASRRG